LYTDDTFFYDYFSYGDLQLRLVASYDGLTFVGVRNEPKSAPIFSFYPHMMMVKNQKMLAPYKKELTEYMEGKRQDFDVPLNYDNFGAPFQRHVYDVVREIPYGEVITYSDLAGALDEATSTRAVQHAIALNPMPIFVPTHRIILDENNLGTCRLGSVVKRELIRMEKGYLHEHH
jgi:methylated-DNA-[protein]-cysteine S-methyltransferase